MNKLFKINELFFATLQCVEMQMNTTKIYQKSSNLTILDWVTKVFCLTCVVKLLNFNIIYLLLALFLIFIFRNKYLLYI